MEPRLLDIKAAAGYLGCSPWTVRDLIWKGEVSYILLGRKQMIAREDLEATIKRMKKCDGSGQVRGKRNAS
jgi:excisionase family DNA binding protein